MTRGLMLAMVGLLILVTLGAWFSNIFLVQPAKNLVSSLQQIAALEQNQQLPMANFVAPIDSNLTAGQIRRFVAVMRDVQFELGRQAKPLAQRFGPLVKSTREGRTPDYRGVLDLFKISGKVIVNAKEVQLKSATREEFSQAEYDWVKAAALAALGLGSPKIEMKIILEQIKRGDLEPKIQLVPGKSTPQNESLVKPYKQEIEEFFPLTLFGL